jgi:3-oxoadipate enol-lactonase
MESKRVPLTDGWLEVTIGGPEVSGVETIGAAHPAGAFGEGPVRLLSEAANARVICVNPRGIGSSDPAPSGQHTYTLQQMVDDLDQVRRYLDITRWFFWGMSGEGWLGQIYAHRYPEALSGLILESICPCFRARLADPTCVLSPFYPAWQAVLADRGLISFDSHAEVGDPNATEWIEIEGVGSVFRRVDGPALLVSPMPVTPEMRSAMPVLWPVDTRAWINVISTPTLIICGSADPIVPVSHARALHHSIQGSEFLIVEGAGHVPVTQKRSEVSEAVQRFLRGLSHF